MLRTVTSPLLTTIIFSCIQDIDLSAVLRNGRTWVELDDALSTFTRLHSGRLQVVLSFSRPPAGKFSDATYDFVARGVLEEHYLKEFIASGGRIDVRTLEQVGTSYGSVELVILILAGVYLLKCFRRVCRSHFGWN